MKLCYGLSILGSVPLVILPFYNLILPLMGYDASWWATLMASLFLPALLPLFHTLYLLLGCRQALGLEPKHRLSL